MTADEREAFLKKVEAMQKNGLDRKTALLSACALYYPEDLKAMQEKAQEVYFGEGLIDSIIAGFLEKVLQTSALDSVTIPACIRKTRQGIDAIEYLLLHGIPLLGRYDSKAPITEGADIEKAYTLNPADIKNLIAGRGDSAGRGKGIRIRRFSFRPKDAGLLCIDVDRKKGKDGFLELQKLFPPGLLPPEFLSIENLEKLFPCYVSTPNHGYHLYFRYDKNDTLKNIYLCPEVELKYTELTAGGSLNAEGKPYILHGSLEKARPLYGIILDRIQELHTPKPVKPQTRQAADKPYHYRKQNQHISFAMLAEESTAKYAGNHARQVSFAGKCNRCGFPFQDALAYVKANPSIFGNDPDTENTIRSIYTGGKK